MTKAWINMLMEFVQLDLLKGDRFLGDADWEIVWRYIPVSTGKSYWHRIRWECSDSSSWCLPIWLFEYLHGTVCVK